jgi:MFS family permease
MSRFSEASLAPYIFFMIGGFDIVKRESDVAFYLGVLSSAFFAARGLSNPFWGWLSDHVGQRKPILLIGTFGGMIGYVLFGFSKSLTWVSIPRESLGN